MSSKNLREIYVMIIDDDYKKITSGKTDIIMNIKNINERVIMTKDIAEEIFKLYDKINILEDISWKITNDKIYYRACTKNFLSPDTDCVLGLYNYINRYHFNIYYIANYYEKFKDNKYIANISTPFLNMYVKTFKNKKKMSLIYKSCNMLYDFVKTRANNITFTKYIDMRNIEKINYFSNKIIKIVELKNINMSYVKSVSNMFSHDTVEKLIMDNVDLSNVTDMTYMFGFNNKIEYVSLTNIKTKYPIKANGMFSGCSCLKTLIIDSNFQFKDSIHNMFNRCISLEYLDLSKVNTTCVTNMNGMFENCKSLKNICLTNFDTRMCTDMKNMFRNCCSLETIETKYIYTYNVTNMNNMFENCSSLKILNLSNFDFKYAKFNNIFDGCSSLKIIKINNCNKVVNHKPKNVTNGCESLKYIVCHIDFLSMIIPKNKRKTIYFDTTKNLAIIKNEKF